MEGRVALFYSETLQVSFWKTETEITSNCAYNVQVVFELERDNGSDKRKKYYISFLLAAFSKCMFKEAGAISLNIKRYTI